MSKVLFTFIFISVQIFCSAQNISITGIRNNIAYVNNSNFMNVAVKGYSCKSLIITTNNGLITKSSSCWYTFIPKDTGTAKIIVNAKINNKVKAIGVTILAIKDLEPIFLIGPGSGGEITKNVFAAQDYARAESYELGCVYYFPLVVNSFTVKIIKQSTPAIEYVNVGNKINTEIKNAFQSLEPGDTIFISNIKATGPDKKRRILKAVTFSIK